MNLNRLYFSDANPCTIQVEKKGQNQQAYLFNLSKGGLCFVVPKYKEERRQQPLSFQAGERLNVKMSPLRLGNLECDIDLLHAREDESYVYYGAKFTDENDKIKRKIAEELVGVQKRMKRKKAPYVGALWLAASMTLFVLSSGFQL